MPKPTLTLLSFLIMCNLFGQNTETVYLDEKDSTRNSYTVIYPSETPYKGYLILIPGFGQSPESVFAQTELPYITAQNRLLTILPTLQDGVLSFGVDHLSQDTLQAFLDDVRSKHKLADLPFFMGGLREWLIVNDKWLM